MSPTQASFRPTLEFCDREAEIERLRAFLSSHTEGIAGCLTSGEAGLGKSTLIARAIEYARQLGYLTISVAAKSHAVDTPLSTMQDLAENAPVNDREAFENRDLLGFWPWLRARVLGSEASSAFDLLADGAELILKPLGTVVRGVKSNLEPHLLLQRLLHKPDETYREYLTYVLGSGSVVLILDDFHWIDAPSILTLSKILQLHPSDALAVILSYRPYECSQNEPAADFVSRLQELDFLDLRLSPLPIQPMSACLRKAAPSLSSEAVEQVAQLCEGNPLLAVEDLTLRLVEADRRKAASYLDPPAGPREPSQKLRRIVTMRLSHLSSLAREYLQIGACLGQSFVLGDVADVLRMFVDRTGLNEMSTSNTVLSLIDIPRVVDELDQLGFLRLTPARKRLVLEFTHPLVHEVIHNGLSPPKRLLLHSCIASLLARQHAAGKQVDLGEVGRHHLAAREYREALRSFFAEGKAAYESEAHLRAAALWQRALACLKDASEAPIPWSPARRSRLRRLLLIRAAECLFRSGQFGEAREHALEVLAANPLKDLFTAEALYWLGKVEYFIGSDEVAIRDYTDCFEIFDSLGRSEGVLRSLNAKAASLVQIGAYNAADLAFRDALTLAPTVEDRWPKTALEAYQSAGMLLSASEAVPVLKHGIEVARGGFWPRQMGLLFHNLGVELYYLGQLDEAAGAFSEARESLLQSVSFELVYTLNSLGVLSLARRDDALALRYFAQAEQRLVANFDRIWLANNMAVLDHLQGRTPEAIQRLERLLSIIETHTDPVIRENSYFNLGLLYFYAGRFEEAERLVTASLCRNTRYPKDLAYAKRFRALARIKEALGKQRQSVRLSRMSHRLFLREHPEAWSHTQLEFIYCHLCNYH